MRAKASRALNHDSGDMREKGGAKGSVGTGG